MLKEVIAENGIKTLNESTFGLCASLKSVKLPDTLEVIGSKCFDGCKKLSEVLLPSELKEIGENAFRGCGLKKITIPAKAVVLGKQVFSKCKMVTAGPIGAGYDYEFGWTTTIPKHAFSGLNKLESVHLPDSICEIGISAFADCKALKTINTRADMKIGKYAFKGCISLGVVNQQSTAGSASPFTIVNGVLSAYSGQEDADITIPDGVTIIASRAFYMKRINSAVIPASVVSVETEAFGFTGLSHVTFLGEPKNIGARAFDTGLTFAQFNSVMTDICTKVPLRSLSYQDDRLKAFLYFLRNYDKDKIDPDVEKDNWKYISQNVNEFEYNLMENDDLRKIMLTHCVFAEEDIDRFIDKSADDRKTTLTAELLEYRNSIRKAT